MRIAIVFPYIADNDFVVRYSRQMAVRFNAFATVQLFGIGDAHDQLEKTELDFKIIANHSANYEELLYTINAQFDICFLHHQFSGFGLEDGLMILPFMAGLRIPAITMFHQLSHLANDRQKNIICSLGQYSTLAIATSSQSVDVLEHIYKVPKEKIRVVEYAVEDYQPLQRDELRKSLGYWGQQVIIAAGMLQRSDNIAIVIELISSLRVKYPNILFKHIGFTHPQELAQQGESYRTELNLLIRRLGLQQHVVLENRCLTDVELMEHMEAADVFIDPLDDPNCLLRVPMMMALTAGCVVVSSSFSHSVELLKDKRGEIYAFDQLDILSDKFAVLLNDSRKLNMYRQSARDLGQHFEWQRVVVRCQKLIEEVVDLQPRIEGEPVNFQLLIPFANNHLSRLINPMGVIVNSYQGIPEVASYNLTINALALMVCAHRHNQIGNAESLEHLNKAIMALNHFWGPKSVSKPNDSDINSDDAAITIAALGSFAKTTRRSEQKEWARDIILRVLPSLNTSSSTASLSFIMMGLVDLLTVFPAEKPVIKQVKAIHQQLNLLFEQTISADWDWFEEVLTTETCVHALAMLKSSLYLNDNELIELSLKRVEFIADKAFEEGHYTSLTSRSKLKTKVRRTDLEQSAIETMWMGLLCFEMGQYNQTLQWYEKALQCYLWFLGENSIRRSLLHFESGAVANSIKGNQINVNDGALGTLAFSMMQIIGYESFCMKYQKSEII